LNSNKKSCGERRGATLPATGFREVGSGEKSISNIHKNIQ